MSADELLRDLEKALDQLIEIAKHLKEESFTVVTSTHLQPLQKKQEDLLILIGYIQKQFKKLYPEEEKRQTAAQQRIRKKLEEFQSLNTNFIENLAATHEVIDVHQKENPK